MVWYEPYYQLLYRTNLKFTLGLIKEITVIFSIDQIFRQGLLESQLLRQKMVTSNSVVIRSSELL